MKHLPLHASCYLYIYLSVAHPAGPFGISVINLECPSPRMVPHLPIGRRTTRHAACVRRRRPDWWHLHAKYHGAAQWDPGLRPSCGGRNRKPDFEMHAGALPAQQSIVGLGSSWCDGVLRDSMSHVEKPIRVGDGDSVVWGNTPRCLLRIAMK